MVDQRATRSRGFMAPVIGGIALIVVIVAAIYFRAQLWDFLKFSGKGIGNWLTEWVPNHWGQTFAAVGFAVFAFALNWFAHVRGRLRAWIFAIVVELGLWLLFWFRTLVPSFRELMGLDIEPMSFTTALLSGVIVIAITGALFWFLEMKEEWNKYRRRHNADDS